MTEPCRWQPDTNLVDHTRISTYPIAKLGPEDRAWVVAGLTVTGYTAEDTARQLQCSLRLIRQIRAEPTFTLAVYALQLRDQLCTADARITDTTRQANRTINTLQAELRRTKTQNKKLVETVKAYRAALNTSTVSA